MDMQGEERTLIAKDAINEEFVADALKAVQIKFVDTYEEVIEGEGYAPEFAHQHFGETEKIVGYKDLSVIVAYSSASLYIYPRISFHSKAPATSQVKPDDILYKISDQLPSTQLDALVNSEATFRSKLEGQRKFQPPGKLISQLKFSDGDGGNCHMQLYKVGSTDTDAHPYVERAQSIAFWYIDAADYTDLNDPRFSNYLIFEVCKSDEGTTLYKFAGYSSIYRWYHYPSSERARIAHLLITPPYRNSGNGVRFLNGIYAELRSDPLIFDITAESPADNFVLMRDYADCLNCYTLPEFSKEQLMKGYSKQHMEQTARTKLKIHSVQARRVYEILRLHYTRLDSEREQYKKEVMKRLSKAMMKGQKDWGRIQRAVDEKNMAMVAESFSDEQRQQLLKEQYAGVIHFYKVVLDRLVKHEPKFI